MIRMTYCCRVCLFLFSNKLAQFDRRKKEFQCWYSSKLMPFLRFQGHRSKYDNIHTNIITILEMKTALFGNYHLDKWLSTYQAVSTIEMATAFTVERPLLPMNTTKIFATIKTFMVATNTQLEETMITYILHECLTRQTF